jgi:hypothetical protein
MLLKIHLEKPYTKTAEKFFEIFTKLMLKQVKNLPTAKLFAQFDANLQVTRQNDDSKDKESKLQEAMETWVRDKNEKPNPSLLCLRRAAKICFAWLMI